MKGLIVLILGVALAVFLAGCGGGKCTCGGADCARSQCDGRCLTVPKRNGQLRCFPSVWPS